MPNFIGWSEWILDANPGKKIALYTFRKMIINGDLMTTGIEVMKSFLGEDEDYDRKQLMEFLKKYAIHGDIAIDPSITSWCAASIGACERAAGKSGTGKLNAQSYKTYGSNVANWDDAKEGDICVFHFPSDSAWQGHVTYFVGWDDTNGKVKCIGGNQSNKVCYAEYSQEYLTDIRRS